MSVKSYKVIQPEYVDQFQCIGSTCEDTCCRYWEIPIDRDTYQKYCNIQIPELKEKIKTGFVHNYKGKDELRYATIKFNKQNYCPFLNEDKLCSFQYLFGEQYLSKTCRTYPRGFCKINDRIEVTVAISCPEAARLILLNDQPIKFIETEITLDDTLNMIYSYPSHLFKNENKPEYFFDEIRLFIINLLQNRNLPLWNRLIVLGLFINKIDELIMQQQILKIPAVIKAYEQYINRNVFTDKFDNIQNNDSFKYTAIDSFVELMIDKKEVHVPFNECLHDFKKGISSNEDRKHYMNLVLQKEYILENYLVNYVFQNVFPFSDKKLLFENYLGLVSDYVTITGVLAGMAGYYREDLTIDHIIKLIYSFGRTTSNQIFSQNRVELLMANGCNKISNVALLLKS